MTRAIKTLRARLKAAEEENSRLQAEYEGSPVRAELESQLEKCKEAVGDEWGDNQWLWEAIRGLQGDAKTLRAFCRDQGATPMMVLSQRDALQRELDAVREVVKAARIVDACTFGGDKYNADQAADELHAALDAVRAEREGGKSQMDSETSGT